MSTELPEGRVEIIALAGLPEVRVGDDLEAMIGDALEATPDALPFRDGDVLVVTQKVVSKAEGAVADLREVTPEARGDRLGRRPGTATPRQVEVVLREARRIVRMANGVLITETEHGFVCANGGVDASNVGPDSGDVVTLLPRDPDASADRIRAALRARFGTDVAVIVSDSFGRPWRWGIVDVALGVSGLLPLDDLRGQPDADGRVMRTTVRAVADEIASAAELALGKTAGRPVALVRGARPHTRRGPDRRAPDARRRTTSSAERDSRYARVMKTGLQISSFTWPGGTDAIGPTLGRIFRDADEAGFDSIWVMDHFFQIRGVGRPEEPMLEGMDGARLHGRALEPGAARAHGRRRPLPPAPLWVKAATTLDVLSGGRAWLGIGAAWNEEESRGLGFPFPPLGERFEMLEETLRFAHDMWSGERGSEAAFEGRHCRRGAPPELAPVDQPAPPADHDRGRRRAEDAAPGRPVRGRDQRVRRPRDDPPQVRGHPRALRGDRAGPRRDRALDAPVGEDRGRRRATARAPSRSSTASASSRTPAAST